MKTWMLLFGLCIAYVAPNPSCYAEVTPLHDPTRPADFAKRALLAGVDKGKVPMIVKGIFKTAKHRYAVIGNESFKVGDDVGDYTIVAITAGQVKVRDNAQPDHAIQIFSIYEQEVKSDATY